MQATPDESNTQYNDSHKYTGTAVIFCNIHFRDLGNRNVARKDVEKLQPVLERKGFKVFTFIDLSTIDMQKELEKVASQREQLEESDCFLCVISSHGLWDIESEKLKGKNRRENVYDVIYDKNGNMLNIRVLTDIVTAKKCPQLAGKPKIFLMQFCRGDSYPMTVDVTSNEDGEVKSAETREGPESKIRKLVGAIGEDPEDFSIPYEIPIKKDFLIHYATTPGYVSFKKAGTGTPFLQAWCDILEKEQYSETDLLSLTTVVNAKVAEDYESFAPSKANRGLDKRKQMPQAVSMLTKDFYLKTKSI